MMTDHYLERELMSKQLKIFQISFGATGTGSFVCYFSHFMDLRRIAYFRYPDHGKLIGVQIFYDNLQNNRSIFHGIDDDEILYFGDLKLGETFPVPAGIRVVQQMLQKYPDAIYLIITRPLSQWIKTKIYAFGDLDAVADSPSHAQQATELFERYFSYYCPVLQHLKRHKARLLLYDIEKDDFQQFKQHFFEKTHIQLPADSHLPRTHKHSKHSFTNKQEPSAQVLLENLCELFVD